ncbi:MAG: hypothetical protein IJO48_06165 [Clostridia bacterium]|nr:hypothetical protein [Clostridia bacterium]
MVKQTYKILAMVLAVLFILPCFNIDVGDTVSYAMPRVENKLIIDTDPQDGFAGEYVIAYNPSQDARSSVTTGIISDQMKNVSLDLSEKAANEPYTVEFEQRISAASVKNAFEKSSKTNALLYSNNQANDYSVGDNRYFNIYADLNDYDLSSVKFKLAAKGEHCYIWIISGEQYALTSEEATAMALEYDSKIYDNMRNDFGEHIDPEENGMLNILVYNIQDGFGFTTNGYTCGYFSYSDIYPEEEYGNNAAMIHIDTYPTIHWKDEYNIQEAYSTIVHELQHLINFSQFLNNPNSPEEESSIMSDWLNECCSLAAEELIYPNSVASSRLDKFMSSYVPYAEGASLYSWSEDIINYSMVYLFGQYIRMQTGGYEAFKEMLKVYAEDSQPTEAKAVESAVKGSALDGYSLSQVVLAYRIAMLANETTAYNGIYGFRGNELFDSLPAMEYTSTDTPRIYGGGAIVIQTKEGVFNPPENSSQELQYVGVTFADEAVPSPTPTSLSTAELTLNPELTVEPTTDLSPTPTASQTVMPTPTQTKPLLVYLSMDKSALLPGEKVNVKVSSTVSSDITLTSLLLDIPFDNKLFTVESVSYLDNFACTVNEDAVKISLNNENAELISGSVNEIAVITLTATTELLNTASCSFNVSDVSYAQTDVSNLEFVAVGADGKIIVPVTHNSFTISYTDMALRNITAGTTAEQIMKMCSDGISAEVFDASQSKLHSDSKVATGTLVVFSDDSGFEAKFTVVIKGDATGDGAINSRDIADMQKRILNSVDFADIYHFDASDINNDEKVNSKDIAFIQKLILNAESSVDKSINNLSKSRKINAFADNNPVITVTASETTVAPGDTITVTVAFEKLPYNNVSVMELKLPINVDVFDFVEGSEQFFIPKGENTICGAIFLPAKNIFFCNYVDVSSAVLAHTTNICSFQLTAKQNVDNVSVTFDLDTSSFLTDANNRDIIYTTHGTEVMITSAQGLQLAGGSSYVIDIVKDYLTNVPASTTSSTVIANFVQSGTIKVLKTDGTVNGDNSKVGTGYEITLNAYDRVIDRLTIIVTGDVTSDGSANSRDLAAMQKHIVGTDELSAPCFAAGDLTNDSKINSRDIAALQKVIVGL